MTFGFGFVGALGLIEQLEALKKKLDAAGYNKANIFNEMKEKPTTPEEKALAKTLFED